MFEKHGLMKKQKPTVSCESVGLVTFLITLIELTKLGLQILEHQ